MKSVAFPAVSDLFELRKYSRKCFIFVLYISHTWTLPELPLLCGHMHAPIETTGVSEVTLAGRISLLTESLQVIKYEALLGSFIAVYEKQLPFLVETLVEGFPLLSPEV